MMKKQLLLSCEEMNEDEDDAVSFYGLSNSEISELTGEADYSTCEETPGDLEW